HVIGIAVGDTEQEAAGIVRAYVEDPEKFFRQRRKRMETLFSDTKVQTDNARFDKALAWAKLSLDALIMNQVTKGIFAGLPWFNNYWGRDTFISLPGACLVLGRFAEAKSILRSFAAYQNTDPSSTDFGRIPNIVTTTDKAYNTADGTPRFVMMVEEYIQRSGDTAFIHEIYPIVKRSIDGTMKYHTDSLGFLVHGDAETWMDAVGPDGPWSPRGNRANDIQALWANQLQAGAWLAEQLADGHSANIWSALRDRITANFTKHFLADSAVADHLNPDGTPDKQLRPNQIFTVGLLDEPNRAKVLQTVVSKLTYDYGVASLSQEDENFHPHHQFEPYYPKDAAYHNGTVWTWVQGPVISELCRSGRADLAYAVTENSVHQILDRGAVGTQSELLDALARPGETEPQPSGTFSQAWNLAEFIRNFYDDYLGARINRYSHTLVLQPRLPLGFNSVHVRLNMDGRGVPINLRRTEGGFITVIDGKELKAGGKAFVSFLSDSGETIAAEISIKPQSETKIELRYDSLTYYTNGIKGNPSQRSITSLIQTKESNAPSSSSTPSLHSRELNSPRPLTLAIPTLRPGLASLSGPDYPLIPHSVLKKSNPSARVIVAADDPAGDDTGIGASGAQVNGYVYPRNPNFSAGCLDITRFTVTTDDSNGYFTLGFRALSNPGWHPEYGFQLTYVAIAIGAEGLAQKEIRHNSEFTLPEGTGYERLVLVGGGVRVEDAGGKVLVAYIPVSTDATNPLGDAASGTISFTIPLSFLGGLDSGTKFTVLVGAQDDHGGAGLGEFRTVNKEAGEWNGGGRGTSGTNVYDMVEVRARF
ncbi:MAG: amylo-alpha-1,6-glucosidase, partial [Bacteroidota bacterium]